MREANLSALKRSSIFEKIAKDDSILNCFNSLMMIHINVNFIIFETQAEVRPASVKIRSPSTAALEGSIRISQICPHIVPREILFGTDR